MKYICETEKLAGKTIKRVVYIMREEKLVFVLENDEIAVVTADFFGDSYDLVLGCELDSRGLFECGLVTKEQYEDLIEQETKENQERMKKMDLMLLKRLKQKYGKDLGELDG